MPSDGGCIHSETRRCEQCAEIATLRSERDTALAELAEARKKLGRDRARLEAELAEAKKELERDRSEGRMGKPKVEAWAIVDPGGDVSLNLNEVRQEDCWHEKCRVVRLVPADPAKEAECAAAIASLTTERDEARKERDEARRERDALRSDLVQANGRVNEERYDHAETCLDLEAVKAARLAALDGQIAAESRLAQAEAALSYADRLLGEHPKLTCAPGAHSPEASGPCEECEWVGAVFRHLQHRAALSPPTTGEKK